MKNKEKSTPNTLKELKERFEPLVAVPEDEREHPPHSLPRLSVVLPCSASSSVERVYVPPEPKRVLSHGDESMTVVLSAFYAKLLIVLGLALPVTSTIQNELYTNITSDIFTLYLYITSMLFLAYTFFHLRIAKRDLDKNIKRTRYGSFYLHMGVAGFGVGTIIYSCLQFTEYFDLSGDCQLIIVVLKPSFRILFLVAQTIFIFSYTDILHPMRGVVIDRFGLMHLIATNVCEWLNVVIQETRDDIIAVAYDRPALLRYTNISGPPKLLFEDSLQNNTQEHMGNGSEINANFSAKIVPWSCNVSNMISPLIRTMNPYLRPCGVEYSLLCSIIIVVIWNDICTVPGSSLYDRIHDYTSTMPYCILKSYKNYAKKVKKVDGILYFRFPRDPIRCSAWSSIIPTSRGQEYFMPKATHIVCSDHFKEDDMYVTGKVIRRIKNTAVPTLQKSKSHRSNNKPEERQCCGTRSNNHFSVDCGSAHKGLFVGIATLAGTIVSLMIFNGLFHNDQHVDIALLQINIWETILFILMTLGSAACIQRMRALTVSKISYAMPMEHALLLVTQSGVYLYYLFQIIGACFLIQTHSQGRRVTRIIAPLCAVVQSSCQTLLVFDAWTRRSSGGQDRPGRQLVTFLLVGNFALWLLNRVKNSRAEFHPSQMEFFGVWAWTLITHVSVPLLVCYRFQATVCFYEIWKNSYKTRKDVRELNEIELKNYHVA